MRIILFLFGCFLWTTTASAATVVIYNESTGAIVSKEQVGRAERYDQLAQDLVNDYVVVDPADAIFSTVPLRYLKVNPSTQAVEEMTQAEKDALDAPQRAAELRQQRLEQVSQQLDALQDDWDALTPLQQRRAQKLLWHERRLQRAVGGP